jgi:hypothetical protein
MYNSRFSSEERNKIKKFIKKGLSQDQEVAQTVDDLIIRKVKPGTDINGDQEIEELEFSKLISDCIHHQIDVSKQVIDGRVELLPGMEPFLHALSSQTSVRNAGKNLFKVRDKFETSKERIEKILQIQSYSEFIEFIQEDPWNWGVLSMPCPSCQKFALSLSFNLNGTWDYMCKNFPYHKHNKYHVKPEVYQKWLHDLETNKNGLAEEFLKEHRIKV